MDLLRPGDRCAVPKVESLALRKILGHVNNNQFLSETPQLQGVRRVRADPASTADDADLHFQILPIDGC